MAKKAGGKRRIKSDTHAYPYETEFQQQETLFGPPPTTHVRRIGGHQKGGPRNRHSRRSKSSGAAVTTRRVHTRRSQVFNELKDPRPSRRMAELRQRGYKGRDPRALWARAFVRIVTELNREQHGGALDMAHVVRVDMFQERQKRHHRLMKAMKKKMRKRHHATHVSAYSMRGGEKVHVDHAKRQRALERYRQRNGNKRRISPTDKAAYHQARLEAEFQAMLMQDTEEIRVYTPWFTVTITLIQILCFAFTLYVILAAKGESMSSLKDNPFFGPSDAQMLELGAKYAPRIVRKGQWWRLFISIFFHSGVLHLMLNLALQVGSGRFLERQHGPWRVALIYFLSAFFGFIVSAIFLPTYVAVGPSGAIYGIQGVLIVDLIQNWKYVVAPATQLFKQILTLVFFALLGLLPGCDNWMHLGGLWMGILSGIVFLNNLHLGVKTPCCLTCTAGTLIVLSFVVAFYALYVMVDVEGWCTLCEDVNCLRIMDWCERNPLNDPSLTGGSQAGG